MNGLSATTAGARLVEFGPNALPERRPDPLWRRVARQFASPLVFLLLFALAFDVALWAFDGATGWPVEAIAVATILLLNAALGVHQERRSEAALARLAALGGAQSWVVRDGQFVRLPSTGIVPGDVVRLDEGDRVPADGTLAGSRGVMADESVLTGESVPVDKAPGDELLSGTLLVRGSAIVEVTRTGPASAMGRLATMLGTIAVTPTPLERRVDALGRQIARWVVTLAALLGALGILAEGWAKAGDAVVFAIALAVAAVPEGLPAVLTVALALGVERMARRRAVVRRLAAVEALGSVTVIATDKTGTLTENRMDVRSVDLVDTHRALRAMALANDADPDTAAGDPLDLGLLRYAAMQRVDVAAVRSLCPVVASRPFDSASRFMRVTVCEEGAAASYLKGAPEVLLARSVSTAAERADWLTRADTYAREGVRVLALAWAPGEADDGLTWLGLVLFWDPPRAEVAAAVRAAGAAGIRVVMITGDHPATAHAVARLIGVNDADVFARVSPEEKLSLVDTLQASGQVVAMTGDGVNDAPALKRSDVGVAMGIRGSDVSREVADLVLLDDNFATIVEAIEEGRSIYENIQKFLRFLFSTNLSEVLLVAVGAALAFTLDLRDATGQLLLPLTAAQILWINLVTDGLPAAALVFDRNPGVMHQRPRPPSSPLLDAPSVRFVVAAGTLKALLGLAVLGLVPRLGYDLDAARATTFHLMAIGQLTFAYASRHTRVHPLPNRYLLGAVVGGVLLQIGAGSIPVVAELLGRAAIPWPLWTVVFAGTATAWAIAEGASRWAWHRPTPSGAR